MSFIVVPFSILLVVKVIFSDAIDFSPLEHAVFIFNSYTVAGLRPDIFCLPTAPSVGK